MYTQTVETLKNLTPEKALEILKAGNKRFVKNLQVNRNLLQQVDETSDGQYPFAAILSCIDSRTSSELIFDQGLGDIFSIRIAGNIVNNDILGSMEYACKVVGSKLIVVLGHTNCGAVQSAYTNFQMGHITALLDKIKPVIRQSDYEKTNREDEVLTELAVRNVHHSISVILEESEIIRQMHHMGKIDIVGALYNIQTGKVNFLER
jgi:carbonic anhydrase